VKQLAVLGAAIALFGFVSAASAGSKPPSSAYNNAPAANYNWSGGYVGGNLGYGWGTGGDPSMSFIDTSGFGLTHFIELGGVAPIGVDPKGVIGGVQFGYNWQVSPHFVLGVVTDFQGSGVKGTGTYFATPVAQADLGGSATSTLENRLDWFGTVRERFGWAQQNWLWYATGGFAYGEIKDNLTFASTSVEQAAGSQSALQPGWTAGAGFEYGWSQWSAGVEYLYVDLGSTNVTETFSGYPGAGGDSVTMSNRNTFQIVRAVLNYRF